MDYLLIGVCVTLSVVITLIAVWGYIKIKFSEADKAISAGMSALGKMSGDNRTMRAMEKGIAGDLMNAQMPEVIAILEQLSPETADMIKENPEIAIKLMEKYQPLIDKFIGSVGKAKSGPKTDFDIGDDPSKYR